MFSYSIKHQVPWRCCEGILQIWLKSIISWTEVREVILDNLSGLNSIHWTNLTVSWGFHEEEIPRLDSSFGPCLRVQPTLWQHPPSGLDSCLTSPCKLHEPIPWINLNIYLPLDLPLIQPHWHSHLLGVANPDTFLNRREPCPSISQGVLTCIFFFKILFIYF